MKTKSLLLATALLMSTSALAQKNTFKGGIIIQYFILNMRVSIYKFIIFRTVDLRQQQYAEFHLWREPRLPEHPPAEGG